MSTLREFLANRRSEIQAQIKALRAELAEIDMAQRALPSKEPPKASSMLGFVMPSGPAPPRDRRMTLKQMAVGVLADQPEGADANTILRLIQEKYDAEVPRPSLSPQLSRLGADGVLKRDGMTWKLVSGVAGDAAEGEGSIPENNETPGGETPDASEQEDDDDLADLLG